MTMREGRRERVVGCDPHGVHRVYAPTLLECHQEAAMYVQRRPDTLPLTEWKYILQRLDDGVVINSTVIR